MQKALTALEKTGEARGLRLNRENCASTSFVKSGNKLKVITERQFKIVDGFMVKQIKPSESIKMLGILFDPAGIKRCMDNFDGELMRITKAPLKLQQRLKILRSFLIPRWYYKLLSLSRIIIKTLRVMDRRRRGCIKKSINLPKDIPIAYPCEL